MTSQQTRRPRVHVDNWVDAQQQSRDNPGTFLAPTPAAAKGAVIGQHVKVCNGLERFWVLVTSVQHAGEKLQGTVDNVLVYPGAYNHGDLIEFGWQHIYHLISGAAAAAYGSDAALTPSVIQPFDVDTV